ncbi:tyrosine-type recombinase/integrase [Bifidobacterium panos]|uniref:Integrase n=1 Tax=Bifidobacterium panos TaxID=2675321 RepID=A0ABX1T0R3_9BIFI|nr:tyrosine-type recombinase/integrase [Bifidobacterium sp. DSM 109963]NMN02758.1 integrase [Bifidobacterium sp. DSM 109963]
METLSELTARFLVGLSPRTQVTYKGRLREWFRWCAENNINALDVNRTHIEVFGAWDANHERRPKRSAYSVMSIICCFYRFLYEEGAIDDDPGKNVRRPRLYGHSDGTCLTREQASRFLGEAERMDAQTYALCCLLLLNGLRIGEALGLNVSDYHPGGRWVGLHRKGDWNQRIAISQRTCDALSAHIRGRKSGAVFRTRTGKRLDKQEAVGIVSSVALRIGVAGITPHSLRRTFCTLARDAGVPDRDIMAAGGWNSPQMLDYYDMARRGMNGEATEALQEYLTRP